MITKRVSVSYLTGNLDPDIEIKKGQLWLYRDNISLDWPKIEEKVNPLLALSEVPITMGAAEVVDIIPGQFGGDEIKMRFLISDTRYCPYEVGEESWFFDINFNSTEGYFVPFIDSGGDLIYNISLVSDVVQHGVYCGQCGDYNAWAEFSNDFKCWACKNGW